MEYLSEGKFVEGSGVVSDTPRRPMTTLTHEESRHLLVVGLGCNPFADDSIFSLISMKGADLMEVDSLDDLCDCGVHSSSRVRLKSMLTAIKRFQSEGVPQEMLPSSEQTTCCSASDTSSSEQNENHASRDSRSMLLNVLAVPHSGSNSVTHVIAKNSNQKNSNSTSGNETTNGWIACGSSTSLYAKPGLEGVSCHALFPHLGVIECHLLDSEVFLPLLAFSAGLGSIIRFITLQELYGSNQKVKKIFSGNYHCIDSGIVRAPDMFYRSVYGCMLPNYPKGSISVAQSAQPVSMSSPIKPVNGPKLYALFTPYLRIKHTPIPPTCSLVMIPIRDPRYQTVLDCSDILRFTQPRRYTSSSLHNAGVRLLVNEVSTSLCNLTRPGVSRTPQHGYTFHTIKQFGVCESTYPLRPVVLDRVIDDDIPSDCGAIEERLYVLWDLHTMSLVAMREGLAVLVTDIDNNNQPNRDKLHLGVLYFPTTVPVNVVQREIEEAHKRCLMRLEHCHWKVLTQLQHDVHPAKSVRFTFQQNMKDAIEESILPRSLTLTPDLLEAFRALSLSSQHKQDNKCNK